MNRTSLSIATFNLYNLNEPAVPVYTDRNGWSQEEHARKIDWTARQLQSMRADVIGLQELWHGASLTRAVAAAGLDNDYVPLVPAGTTGKGIVCAALVAKGLLSSEPEWISDFPEGFRLSSGGDDAQTPTIAVAIAGFSRPVLHFTIKPRVDEPDIHVYGVI